MRCGFQSNGMIALRETPVALKDDRYIGRAGAVSGVRS
jgi:hypothetical protein